MSLIRVWLHGWLWQHLSTIRQVLEHICTKKYSKKVHNVDGLHGVTCQFHDPTTNPTSPHWLWRLLCSSHNYYSHKRCIITVLYFAGHCTMLAQTAYGLILEDSLLLLTTSNKGLSVNKKEEEEGDGEGSPLSRRPSCKSAGPPHDCGSWRQGPTSDRQTAPCAC